MSKNLRIEDARIIFRNFSGKPSDYNRAGNRNFCVVIDDPETANELLADGWNVKTLKPRDDGGEPAFYIQVTVKYDYSPPKIVEITSSSATVLEENEVGLLDNADIARVDLVITPYDWQVNNHNGIKAYLKSMYVTLNEDDFALKYGI